MGCKSRSSFMTSRGLKRSTACSSSMQRRKNAWKRSRRSFTSSLFTAGKDQDGKQNQNNRDSLARRAPVVAGHSDAHRGYASHGGEVGCGGLLVIRDVGWGNV